MKTFLHSLVTAALIAGTVQLFTVQVLAPVLPPFVGPADLKAEKSLKFPSPKLLRLSNADGSVNILVHADESDETVTIEADIRIYLRPHADWAAAKVYLASAVEVRGSGDVLEVSTKVQPGNMDIQVDYTIFVPAGTNIETVGSNGNIWVAQGCGSVTVRGENSDINILGATGTVVAENTNGRIQVVDALNGATLDSVNGTIHARMRGGRLEATSLNGHIVAHVEDNAVVACDLASQNGGITVVLHEEGSATVEASTNRGIIKSDFGFGQEPGVQDGKILRGTLGLGAVKLHLESLNGNIWVAKG